MENIELHKLHKMEPLKFTDTSKANQNTDVLKKETEEIKDIYINRFDASVFINYGKKDCDIRMISKGNWNLGNEEDDGSKNQYLIENSLLVTVDDAQIQEKMQEIHASTSNTEHQIYIVLDKDTAEIKATLGKEGIDGKVFIDAYTKNSSKFLVKTDKEYALLGQVHTHNLKNSENDNSIGTSVITLGGEKEVNDFGTSKDLDKALAIGYDINIYALDSWNFPSKRAEVSIGRVTPKGVETEDIGKTIGKNGRKTVNIGLECLNLRVGR